MDSESSETAISRIKEYPVVKDTFSKASEYYNWIKGQNSTLNSTLNWTEGNIKTVINKVEPIATAQLGSVDRFACSQLDKLESKYPIVKDSSENIIKTSSEYYDSSIRPKVDKIVAAKDSAVYVAKSPYRLASQSIAYLSNTTNNFVTSYMSHSSNANSATGEVERKEYDVLFGRAIKELDAIRSFSKSNIEGLTNVLSSIYDQSVGKNQEWIRQYYQEFSKEIESKTTDNPDSQQTLLQIATSFTSRLRLTARAMSTVCYNHLSAANKEAMDAIFNKTELMYTTLCNSSFKELQEKVTVENVKLLGQNSIVLLGHMKDALTVKYQADIGQMPSLDTHDEHDLHYQHDDTPPNGHQQTLD